MKNFKVIVIFLGFIFMICNPMMAGEKIIDYGLEDCDGKDVTVLSDDIKSNTTTIRFKFRLTGHWKAPENSHMSQNGGQNFIGLYEEGGFEETSSAILKLLNGDNINTRYSMINISPAQVHYYETGIDLQDGNWHSVSFRVVRNNNSNQADNATVTVWWDDWDLSGNGQSLTVTIPDFGSRFHHIALGSNWSNRYANSDMGMDINTFEVWDGMPNVNASTFPAVTAKIWIE